MNTLQNQVPDACDCARLIRPLTDQESLPDHLCEQTAAATVREWARDTWAEIRRRHRWVHEQLLETWHGGHGTDEFDAMVEQLPPIGTVQSNLDAIGQAAGTLDQIPLAFGHAHQVFLVIRQWAQEPGKRTLAQQLDNDFSWKNIIDRITSMRAESDSYLAESLRYSGLPWTPATVDYARAVASGDHSKLPSRGLLVTTLVIFNLADGRQEAATHVKIEGDSMLGTYDIFNMAGKIARRHRDWVKHSMLVSEFADVTEIRRAAPGSFFGQSRSRSQRKHIDYLDEALAGVDEFRKTARGHRNGVEGAITVYLNTVYRRVRKRRKAAGLSLTPPKNWRRDARKRLRANLH